MKSDRGSAQGSLNVQDDGSHDPLPEGQSPAPVNVKVEKLLNSSLLLVT